MRILPLILGLVGTSTLLADGFYVGTYTKDSTSKGIYHGELDAKTGALGNVALAGEAANPSFVTLSKDGKFLYAAQEDATPSVGAFRVEPGGKLTPLGQMPSGGKDPCHVSLDRTGRFLFVANYTGGSVAAFSIKPDGSFDKRTALVQFTGSGPNESRQSSPHLHSIYASADNRFVYACDLGTDKVRILNFDAKTGALSGDASASVPGGAGPRHLAFSADGKYAYSANEMGLSVTAFSIDAKTGALTPMQSILAHDLPNNRASQSLAEIEIHPSGKWLYVSSRGDNTLSVFEISTDGKLTLLQNTAAGAKVPRGFALSPDGSWFVVAGQDDDRITTFAIDPKSGRLEPTSAAATVGKPVSILFAK